MRIAVCDDEHKINELFSSAIDKYRRTNLSDIELNIYDSYEKFNFEESGQYDLVFMDIELGESNGIELIKRMRNNKNYITQVVFVSGRDGYYKDVLDVMPMGFIDKPVQEEKIFYFLNVIFEQNKMSTKVFEYHRGGELYRTKFSDILYFESHGRIITIHTVDGQQCYYGKLKETFNAITNANFIKCHNSYIANTLYVRRIGRNSVEPVNGEVLPVSKKYSKTILDSIQ